MTPMGVPVGRLAHGWPAAAVPGLWAVGQPTLLGGPDGSILFG